jgi:hypothetical protein
MANSTAGIQPESRYDPSSRSNGRRFRRSLLGVEAADDRLENVGAGHHALERAIFVMDQPHMDRGVAQDGNDVPRIQKFRNDRHRANQLGDIRQLFRQIAVQHVLGVDDPDRGIGAWSNTTKRE